jgi:two-component system chemotaxis response regulator CheB
MPPHFMDTFVKHLQKKTLLRVKIAENMEAVSAGTVYIAPGGRHMKLDSKNRIRLVDSPQINGVKPSADVLFESVAESFQGSAVLTVILTGMGHDGGKGLALLKEKKDCFCIAQSEKTCVVYGMPRTAVECGLTDMILDLNQISRGIESFRDN